MRLPFYINGWHVQLHLSRLPLQSKSQILAMRRRKLWNVLQNLSMRQYLQNPLVISQVLHSSDGLQDILTQLGLSELRGIAREYEIVTNGMNKVQLVEAIIEALNQPEAGAQSGMLHWRSRRASCWPL